MSEPFEATVKGRRVVGLRDPGGGADPCLVVHGAGKDHRTLSRLAACLAPSISPSLPGRLESEGPPLGSVAEMADFCEALLDALGLERVRVLGHSLGGAVALELALRGARVSALALVSTGARLRVGPAILETARGAVAAGGGNPFGDPCIPAATALADWLAADGFDRLHDLAGARMPTWVAVGADDALTPPRYAEYLARHLSAALRVFPGAGHELAMEQPEALAGWLFM